MQFSKLLEYEQEALSLPHYQHAGLTQEQRQELAFKSFDRMDKSDQQKVVANWNSYCDSEGLFKEDKVERLRNLIWYRFLAQTNLFFLCKLLEKYKDIAINTHEEICNDFFVSKDPTIKTFEEFAKQYSGLKERMLLVPRGGFKSSIDIADCVQWVICFPEVTILILTGVYGLAKDFVGELRGHFTLDRMEELDANDKPVYKPKNTGDGISIFQVLFAEHTVNGMEKETEYATPANRMKDKEPTVRAAGIEQSLSGWHFGILKLDDVVTNENSQTVTRLESVNKQISINQAMLHPFGFFDVIGTWYDEADYYGINIKYEQEFAKEQGMEGLIVGDPFEGRFNAKVNIDIYLRAAWWPTDEAKAAGKIEEEMVEKDWVLWFPERLPYKFLLSKKKKDPYFAIKYENNPRKMHQVKFPRELLVRRTVPASQLPQTGLIVTTIDTAYSVKSWADFTVMITALIYGGKFYIIDMVRGKFNEYELPAMVAATGYKWKPKRISIEDSMGVRWLSREIRREMDKLKISIPLDFISLGGAIKSKSKEIKAKPVLRMLGDGRLFFSNACTGLEEIYTEMEKFTGKNDRHDDIVSGLSLLCEQYAGYADMDAKTSSYVNIQYTADQKSKERHDMIYGLGKYMKHNASYAPTDDTTNPVTAFQIERMGGTPAMENEIDPLQDLIG